MEDDWCNEAREATASESFLCPARSEAGVPCAIVFGVKQENRPTARTSPPLTPEKPKSLLKHGIGAITSQGDGSDVF